MRNLNGEESGISRCWKRSGYLKKFDNSLTKTNKIQQTPQQQYFIILISTSTGTRTQICCLGGDCSIQLNYGSKW